LAHERTGSRRRPRPYSQRYGDPDPHQPGRTRHGRDLRATPPGAPAQAGRRPPLRAPVDYQPSGDQPTAIAELAEQARQGERDQVLLGVTGSGKTFTMAKVVEELQRPALVLAPNKILAAQLYGEFKQFFPTTRSSSSSAITTITSPRPMCPRSDTYIEKESSVNEAIDRMRHSATRSLLERDDVLIVASVSCLYGIGSVETYSADDLRPEEGPDVDQREIIRKLVALQYKRNDAASRAAISGCAATRSKSSRRIMTRRRGGSPSSATRSTRSASSIR
jgi:excinuclease ABC subunit B